MQSRSARGGVSRALAHAAALVALGSAFSAGCSSDSPTKVGLASGCKLNSDCDSSLICTFGACHAACSETKDCAPGERCTKTADHAICQFVSEAECLRNSDCPTPLTCAVDRQCRTECTNERDCTKGQICAQGSVCAEPSEVTGDGALKNAGDAGPVGAGGTPGAGGTSAGGAAQGGAGGQGNGGTSSGGVSAGGASSGGAASGGASSGGTSAGGAASGGVVGTGGVVDSGTPDEPDASVPVDAGPPCGEFGQACCASAPACVSGKNLACGATACECDLGFSDCDTDPKDGCESDPTVDGKNCGSCGHDCGGGQCSASQCQPLVLVSEGTGEGQAFTGTWAPGGSAGAYDFVPMDANGYVLPVTNQATGKYQLRAFDASGTPGAYLTSEAAGIGIAYGPWITPSGIFWYDNVTGAPTIRRVSRGGGTVSAPYTIATSFSSLRVDAGTLYIRDGNALVKIPSGSLTPTPVYDLTATAGSNQSAFGVSGSAVFLIVARALHEGTTDGQAFALKHANFLPAGCAASGVAATAAAVFAYGQCSNSQGFISRWDRTQDSRSDLLLGNASIQMVTHLVADATNVYFVDNGGPYRLYKAPQAGGAPVLVSSIGPFYGLGQLGNSLYSWSGNAPPRGLSRTTKP